MNITCVTEKGNLQNHELRANSLPVKRRFRIYQVLSKLEPRDREKVFNLLKSKSDSLSETTINSLLDFDFLQLDGSFRKLSDKNELIEFLNQHLTKKHSQKALVATMLAPSALSIPDDVCHYNENELRTLTVREMARI